MLNDEDILLLLEFCKRKPGEYFKTWELMKKICKEPCDREHMRIKKRMERLAQWGLFKIESNSKSKTYIMNSSRVYRKKIKFKNRKTESDCICVFRNLNGQSSWEAFEVPSLSRVKNIFS